MDGDRNELKRKLAVYFEEANQVALSDITKVRQGAGWGVSVACSAPPRVRFTPHATAPRQHLDAKSLSIAKNLPHTSADRLHGHLVTQRDVVNRTSHLDENTFTPHFYTNEHKAVDAANGAHQPVTQMSQASRHDRLYNQAVEQRQRQAVLELTRMIDEFGPLGGPSEAQKSPRVQPRPQNPEVPFVEDRLTRWLEARNQKRDMKKQELTQEAVAECTFRPESATRHYRPDTTTTRSSPRSVPTARPTVRLLDSEDGFAAGDICGVLTVEPPPPPDSPRSRNPASPLEQTSPVKTYVEIQRSRRSLSPSRPEDVRAGGGGAAAAAEEDAKEDATTEAAVEAAVEAARVEAASGPPGYSDVAADKAATTPRSRTRTKGRRAGSREAKEPAPFRRVVRMDEGQPHSDDEFLSSLAVQPRTRTPTAAVDLL